eukprot:NODE_42_length_4090_cov_3.876104.p1 GENE.NODE_42_length_4090_cov_3.876104~~NODE_42_length_4090_cov_3.876104.p1  ORF type:complete len:1157 (-),score=272.98 NODE_42_length_4090_cov_3.876104:20-3490(-)
MGGGDDDDDAAGTVPAAARNVWNSNTTAPREKLRPNARDLATGEIDRGARSKSPTSSVGMARSSDLKDAHHRRRCGACEVATEEDGGDARSMSLSSGTAIREAWNGDTRVWRERLRPNTSELATLEIDFGARLKCPTNGLAVGEAGSVDTSGARERRRCGACEVAAEEDGSVARSKSPSSAVAVREAWNTDTRVARERLRPNASDLAAMTSNKDSVPNEPSHDDGDMWKPRVNPMSRREEWDPDARVASQRCRPNAREAYTKAPNDEGGGGGDDDDDNDEDDDDNNKWDPDTKVTQEPCELATTADGDADADVLKTFDSEVGAREPATIVADEGRSASASESVTKAGNDEEFGNDEVLRSSDGMAPTCEPKDPSKMVMPASIRPDSREGARKAARDFVSESSAAAVAARQAAVILLRGQAPGAALRKVGAPNTKALRQGVRSSSRGRTGTATDGAISRSPAGGSPRCNACGPDARAQREMMRPASRERAAAKANDAALKSPARGAAVHKAWVPDTKTQPVGRVGSGSRERAIGGNIARRSSHNMSGSEATLSARWASREMALHDDAAQSARKLCGSDTNRSAQSVSDDVTQSSRRSGDSETGLLPAQRASSTSRDCTVRGNAAKSPHKTCTSDAMVPLERCRSTSRGRVIHDDAAQCSVAGRQLWDSNTRVPVVKVRPDSRERATGAGRIDAARAIGRTPSRPRAADTPPRSNVKLCRREELNEPAGGKSAWDADARPTTTPRERPDPRERVAGIGRIDAARAIGRTPSMPRGNASPHSHIRLCRREERGNEPDGGKLGWDANTRVMPATPHERPDSRERAAGIGRIDAALAIGRTPTMPRSDATSPSRANVRLCGRAWPGNEPEGKPSLDADMKAMPVSLPREKSMSPIPHTSARSSSRTRCAWPTPSESASATARRPGWESDARTTPTRAARERSAEAGCSAPRSSTARSFQEAEAHRASARPSSRERGRLAITSDAASAVDHAGPRTMGVADAARAGVRSSATPRERSQDHLTPSANVRSCSRERTRWAVYDDAARSSTAGGDAQRLARHADVRAAAASARRDERERVAAAATAVAAAAVANAAAAMRRWPRAQKFGVVSQGGRQKKKKKKKKKNPWKNKSLKKKKRNNKKKKKYTARIVKIKITNIIKATQP